MRPLTTILITLFACADALSSESQAATSGENIFGGSFAEAAWTVLAFVVMLIVLGKFAWKPLLKALNDREEHIKQQIDAAENARKLAEKMLEDHKKRGLQIIEEANNRAQQREQEMMETSRRQILELRQQAAEHIEKAHAAAVEQLWEQAGDIVLALGKEVLGRTITDKDNQQLIHDAIAGLRQ